MTNLYPVSKRKPKTSLEKSVAATITMSPLKLNKHKEFSKSIGESLSEFYRVAADMRMKKEKIRNYPLKDKKGLQSWNWGGKL